jgi:hypothetical protein
MEGYMQREIPDYSLFFGRKHVSASGATQPIDEHVLKLYLRKEHKMNFPFAARPRAGQIVQSIADMALGVHDYSPIHGPKEPMDIDEAISRGLTEFEFYKPRDWDGGKDAEEYHHFKEVIPTMARYAVEGIREFYKGVSFEGEYQRLYNEEKLDVPVILFQDFTGAGRQIDLKCSLPVRNPPKKDGTRTWRNPKPKTEPTAQQIMQQAVYNKATGDEPGLLFVTPAGYNIVTAENCDALKPEALEATYQDVVQRWVVQQNLLKAANQNWATLFGLVQPDFGQIAGRHGPDILKIARETWRV